MKTFWLIISAGVVLLTNSPAIRAQTIPNVLDSVIYESCDNATGVCVPDSKQEFKYDANGKSTLEGFYLWDGITNQWIGLNKIEYTYDANGNKTLIVYYLWDETMDNWMPASKTENTFDADGNGILNIDYNWDITTSSWISKMENTYDGDGTQNFFYQLYLG